MGRKRGGIPLTIPTRLASNGEFAAPEKQGADQLRVERAVPDLAERLYGLEPSMTAFALDGITRLRDPNSQPHGKGGNL